MLDPKLLRTYEVQVGDDPENFVPVHWEQLEAGDTIRQYEAGSQAFTQHVVETLPFLVTEGGNQFIVAPLNMFPDDPDADGTDNAHPAWWRGQDAAVAMLTHTINEILDGKDNGAGVMAEPLESLRRRLLALNSKP